MTDQAGEGASAGASAPDAGRARRGGIGFILVTVFLDTMSFGVLIPVLPLLIADLAGGDAAHQALVYGAFSFVWALMQFFAQPVLGALSDRYGRRPVILFSNFGVGLQYVMFAFAQTLPMMFAARMFSGVASASASTCSAYIADVTAPEKRAGAFGMMGAAFGAGFVIGPAFGGWLSVFDPHLPLWVAAILCLLSGLYGLFVLPESLAPELRRPFSWRRANPWGAFRFLAARRELGGLAGVKFLLELSHMVFPAVFVLFAAHQLGWTSDRIGTLMTISGVFGIIVQAGLVGRVVKAIGERRALMIGLGVGVLGLSIYGVAQTPAHIYLALVVFAFWGFANPSVQALLTRRVGPADQGALQGAVGGLTSLAGLIGPLLYTGVFSYFVAANAPAHLPGAPFLVAASLLVMAFGLALAVARVQPAAATAD